MGNFEVFVRPRNRREQTDVPSATLLKDGRKLSLNHAAYAALGTPQFVILLFSAGTREIGLRAARPDEGNAYRVGHNAHSRTWTVTVAGLARLYRIAARSARRLDTRLADGLLIATLGDDP